MAVNGYYIGTDLKFKINIEAEGFDMDLDDYSLVLKLGNDTIDVPPENIVKDGEGNTFLLVNTSQLKSGMLQLIVMANVPDGDFPTGIRHEVEKKILCSIINV